MIREGFEIYAQFEYLDFQLARELKEWIGQLLLFIII